MASLIPGLVSITFRDLQPREIVDLCQQAELKAIEWGGDLHVPHGDLASAESVAAMTAEASMVTSAYGSYYRAGTSEHDGLAFETVLETAQHLQTDCIRVWAGNRASTVADASYRKWVVEELQRICEIAQAAGIRITLEYHVGTLTDTHTSARQLLDEVAHSNCRTLWQPLLGSDFVSNLEGLKSVLPELSGLHVFHSGKKPSERYVLADGEDHWLNYLELASDSEYGVCALLEFVKDNTPAQFLQDAEVLRQWICQIDQK